MNDYSSLPAYLLQQPEIPPNDFIAQVCETVRSLGGMPAMFQISAVLMLLVSSMKVSFLNQLIWNRLGAAKAWIAPLLALVIGVLRLGPGELTLAGVTTYLLAGTGAVFLHEFVDSFKQVPWAGRIYQAAIDRLSKLLGASQGKKEDDQ